MGLVPIKDTDSQRIGSEWHKLLELASLKPGSVCPDCGKTKKNPACLICCGEDFVPDDPMDIVIRYIEDRYKDCPADKTVKEWEIERVILLYSLIGYRWTYANDRYENIATEIEFSIPVVNRKTGRALPNVIIDGRIDKIVRLADRTICIIEHKSTGSSVAPDSTYWNHLNLDTQTRLYPYAARYLQRGGYLIPYGIKPEDNLVNTVLYDVFHKPNIRPKKLTQAESKKFINTGEYMGQSFDIHVIQDDSEGVVIEVDGQYVEYEPGKKENTFSIVETPEMFGCRLLYDISERPGFYFGRKLITRTDQELDRFDDELKSIYRTLKFLDKSNNWWMNEHQCEATYKCPYLSICYNGVQLDPDNPPDGFRYIFTN